MTRTPLLALAAAALAALSLGLAACGSDDSADAPAPAASTPSTAPPPATAPAAGAATVLDVTADPNGSLAFTETALTAPAGAVTLKLTNDAPVPHNIAVEGDGVESPVSETIQGGGTAEITVDLPAGAYTYYCAVPGHRAAGMEGALTAQ